MSYGRMAQAALAAEVEDWLARIAAADTADDAEQGRENRGDELPDRVADKPARLVRIRAARRRSRPRRMPGAAQLHRLRQPAPQTRDGFIQGDHRQLAVDSAHQIVAQRLTTNGSDQDGLVPQLDATNAALRRKPREISADAASAANLTWERWRRAASGATWRQAGGSHGGTSPSGRRQIKPASRMVAIRPSSSAGRSRSRLRQQTVEPVIGQIKQARGVHQFLRRGVIKVKAEWAVLCTAHSLYQADRRRDCLSRRSPEPRDSRHAHHN
jgi:hypothetical protein